MKLYHSSVTRIAVLMAVFLAQATAEATPKPEWKEAFAQGPFQLGTPLNLFRSMRSPDNKAAFPVCSDRLKSNEADYVEALLSDAQLRKAGVVKCVFFLRSKFNVPINLETSLGGKASTTEFYFINPDRQSEKYLFLIYTKGPARNFPSLVPALEKVYGQPTLSTEAWQNKSGAKSENKVATWKNSVSQIEFKQLGLSLDFYSLHCTLTPLMAVLNARLG